MKKIYIIIGVIIVIVGIIILLLVKKKEEVKVEIKDILSFHLSYSNGYMANSNIIYELYYDKKTDKYIVSVKPYLVDDEDKVTVEVSNDFREKIKDIIIKYNVAKWNGFKKYDQNVLDGDGFSFHVRMDDNQEIEADGYMSWPDNYREVVSEYDNLFMNIYNKEKGIKEDE